MLTMDTSAGLMDMGVALLESARGWVGVFTRTGVLCVGVVPLAHANAEGGCS